MGNARWTGVRLKDVLDRAGVRVREIQNVDEIADTGSVARVVVRAQDLKMGAAA